jgi:hypothetical protein
MTENLKNKLLIILPFIVILSGLMVIIGWLFDITVFKSILNFWVAMKFSTAIAFVLSGITLYFLSPALKSGFGLPHIVISIAVYILVLMMGIMFFSALLGAHTGIEDLFVKEGSGSVKTVFPGRPSLPTISNFLLISLSGILTILKTQRVRRIFKIIGIIIIVSGALAVIGYMINVPLLYYYIQNINSAMAINTAVLFILMGTGLICQSE